MGIKKSLCHAAALAAEDDKKERHRKAQRKYYSKLSAQRKAARIRHNSQGNKRRLANLSAEEQKIFRANDARRNREKYWARKNGTKLEPGRQSASSNKREIPAKSIAEGYDESEIWRRRHGEQSAKFVEGDVDLVKLNQTPSQFWSEPHGYPGHYCAMKGLPGSFWQCEKCSKGFWNNKDCRKHERFICGIRDPKWR